MEFERAVQSAPYGALLHSASRWRRPWSTRSATWPGGHRPRAIPPAWSSWCWRATAPRPTGTSRCLPERRDGFAWPGLLTAPVLVVVWGEPGRVPAPLSGAGQEPHRPRRRREGLAGALLVRRRRGRGHDHAAGGAGPGLGASFFGMFEHEQAVRRRFGVPRRPAGRGHRRPRPSRRRRPPQPLSHSPPARPQRDPPPLPLVAPVGWSPPIRSALLVWGHDRARALAIGIRGLPHDQVASPPE